MNRADSPIGLLERIGDKLTSSAEIETALFGCAKSVRYIYYLSNEALWCPPRASLMDFKLD